MEKQKMMHKRNKLIKLIQLGILATGQSLTEEMADKFITYLNLINSYQQKVNITSIEDPHDIIFKHFIDSLSCIDIIKDIVETYPQDKKIKLVDVGSGAGLPGIPLKIVLSSAKMLLLEARKNKTIFLSEAVEKLSLTDTKILQDRAENIGKNIIYRENFNIVLSRAVAPLSVLGEYCLPLCQIGGIMIAFKGSSYADEVSNSIKVIEMLGGTIEKISIVKIPNTDYLRYLLVIKKIKPTPDAYPRRNGIPLKRPLCF